MANHKSALKRHRQSLVRRSRNRAIKSVLKSSVKSVRVAVEQNSQEEALAALKAAIPVINRAAGKGTIHKRNASRKVSRLTRSVNAMSEAGAQ
ncbi:MAG: 30S ribosomal protein S20 [Desulfurivibrionaceae bacterium]|nr:30S ribosomal protein S20 [Desulfobulbales bacterium]MDT8334733.1 30S ribosomal protein S20 [Desulfurivibrionaceae bacterium]